MGGEWKGGEESLRPPPWNRTVTGRQWWFSGRILVSQNWHRALLNCPKWSAPKECHALLLEAQPLKVLPMFSSSLKSQGLFIGTLFCLSFLDPFILSLWSPAYKSINWTISPGSWWLRHCVKVSKASWCSQVGQIISNSASVLGKWQTYSGLGMAPMTLKASGVLQDRKMKTVGPICWWCLKKSKSYAVCGGWGGCNFFIISELYK